MNQHKYDSGIIGNGSYIAHINRNADIVWLCLPNFDSSPIFGSLIDNRCGTFELIPNSKSVKTNQIYIENTNILRTEIQTETGSFAVVDFAPRYYEKGCLKYSRNFFRKIIPLSGDIKIKIKISPSYNYGNKN